METNDLKILAIDDNRDNLMALRAVLSDRLPESRLLTALTGPQGLELARAENPAVILLDIVMPGMDGYEVCRELKKDERLQTIPVLFLTALKTDPDSHIKALEAGAEGFLSKPLDEFELIAQIRAMAKIKAANQLQRLEKTELAAMVVERTRELEQELVERRRAEEALRESEARLRLSVAASNIGLWDWDLVTNKVYFSPEWKSQLGYTEDEISNHFEEWQSRIHPDDLAPALARVQIFIADPATKYATEFRLRHKNGSYRWIFSQGQIFNDTAGKPARMMGCHIDTTDQKKLEMQFLHAQKMESIGTLAGGVAHDFNNILTAIFGHSELILAKMKENDPVIKHVEEIIKASKRAAVLTQSLLAFSRKQPVTLAVIDINEVIMGNDAFLRRLIREDIEFETNCNGETLPVLADRVQIEQVIMNLVANGRDAMPKGGKLSIEALPVTLDQEFTETHGYGKAGEYVLFSVSDNGIGMDKETQSRIFEPFFSTKEQGKGTGLGLAMSYGIIKKHDGFINVYSEPGTGTIFKIYLPRVADAVEIHEESPKEPAALRDGTETILVCEDDVDLRKLAVNILSHFGYRVIEAVDGQDAVEKFVAHKEDVDLVIIDAIMPKKNGKVAYNEMKAVRSDLKTIFVSGYARDIFEENNMFDESTIFINKPYSPIDLLAKAREMLDKK